MIQKIDRTNRCGVDVPVDKLSEPTLGQGGYQGLNPRTEILPKSWRKDANTKPLPCDIKIEHDQAFVVRDGCRLYADIYRPASESTEKIPAIVCWGPFGKKFNGLMSLKLMTPWNLGIPEGSLSGLETFEGPDPADWVPRGFAIVNVDARGSHDSEGIMCVIGSQEGQDGHDVIEGIAKLPWCNGNVGMAGNSHLAIMQWHIAAQKPPSLKAIAPWEGCGDLYREQFGRGGIYSGDLFDRLIQKYMLKGRNGVESCRREFQEHPLMNAFWADKRPDMSKIEIPAYITGTWSNTMHGMGAIRGWLELKGEKWLRWHPTQEWYDLWANGPAKEELMTYFDRYLKGIDNGWENTPKVRMAVLRFGETESISNLVVEDFPLPNTEYQQRFLSQDNQLTETRPLSPSSVSYNSEDPKSIIKFVHKFSARTRMIGIPKAVLHVSCDSHDDMDIFVILKKLSSTGEPLLCLNVPWAGVPVKSIEEIPSDIRTEVILYTGPTGVLRASHREIDESKSMHQNWPFHPHTREQKIPPGEIVRLEIGIWATGIEYEAGESISLEIGGFYPAISNFGTSEHLRNKGQHQVHFGGEYDSHVVLPFV